MENIFKIMKDFGIEMPEDKKADFEKSVLENYKTVNDYNKQVESLDKANKTIKANDDAMKDLQTKLDTFKDVDVTELNKTIKDLKAENARIEQDYKDKEAQRDFDDLIKMPSQAHMVRTQRQLLHYWMLIRLCSQRTRKRTLPQLLRSSQRQRTVRCCLESLNHRLGEEEVQLEELEMTVTRIPQIVSQVPSKNITKSKGERIWHLHLQRQKSVIQIKSTSR